MSETFEMFSQETLLDTDNATSSQGSADGPTPSVSRDGKAPSGLAHVPASPSLWREKAVERMTKDTFGPLFDGLSPSAGLQLSLENRLRARMASYGSPEFVLTWKRKAMLSGPPICALRASGRRTSGKGCIGAGWMTPSSRTGNAEGGDAAEKELRREHQGGTPSIYAQVHLASWPTPNVPNGGRMGEPTQKRKDGSKKQLSPEECASLAGWPTATVNDAKNNAGESQFNRATPNLNTEVFGLLPSGTPAETGKQGEYRLNPMFSLWLMGFPISWAMSGLKALISQKAIYKEYRIALTRFSEEWQRCSHSAKESQEGSDY